MLSIIIVRQHGVPRRVRQDRREPLDRVNVDHTLHVEQIDSDFNRISLAYLVYRLDIRPVYQLLHLLGVQEFRRVRALELLQLLVLLLFVLVHPEHAGVPVFHNVHLVVSAVLGWHRSSLLDAHATLHATLLSIEVVAHVLTAIGEFILETGFQTFV